MIYSEWGCFDNKNFAPPRVSKLGFGTTRFLPENLQDSYGVHKCVELVEYAIEKGINYFDVAPSYSNGLAETILGQAFINTDKPIYVAAKSGLQIDKTADDILKRIEKSIKTLNRVQLDFYHIWSIMNLQQYEEIMRPGGLYEGVVKAKELGLIKHICVSLHCNVSEALKIVDDGKFEGITISMNAINYRKWLPVLEIARKKQVAVVTMNSLGGGNIPRYAKLFKDLDETQDSVPVKALRFLATFDGVDVLLSGMSTKEQIDENCSAFDTDIPKNEKQNFIIDLQDKLCSGCNYCSPCTVNIPISSCMQAYNHKFMIESDDQNCLERNVVNEMFVFLRSAGVDWPKVNKCIVCRKCEKKCTQKIDISSRLQEMQFWAEKYGYTTHKMEQRLLELLKQCENAKKIAIWPACDYANTVLDFWHNDDLEKRLEYFNISSAMWGRDFRGKKIHSPNRILDLDIDTVIIMNYRFQNEIYIDLSKRLPKKINILKLHTDNDISWFGFVLGK